MWNRPASPGSRPWMPFQYWLVWTEWYGLFTIFIPVYCFLIMPALTALRGSLYLTRPTLMAHTANRANLDEMARELFGMITSSRIKVEISHRYPMSEAAEAHRDLEARRTTGQSILLP